MDTTTIITAALTSTVVSGIIVFSVQTIIKTRIEHHYQRELEEIKSHLSVETNLEQLLANRRNEAYPIIVELIYKTRNMARDIITLMNFKSKSFLDEFSFKVGELENLLYKYRIDLERDKCFIEIHQYKNLLLNLNLKISDIVFFLEHNAEEKAVQHKNELDMEFRAIDLNHTELIKLLSNKK